MIRAAALAAVLALASTDDAASSSIAIIDGDTLRIDGVTIRILNIDAPESFRSRCERELVLGLAAKERLRQLVDGATVTWTATGTDRYGRTLATVKADGIDVGEALVAGGYAVRWKPGPAAWEERLAHWCGA